MKSRKGFNTIIKFFPFVYAVRKKALKKKVGFRLRDSEWVIFPSSKVLIIGEEKSFLEFKELYYLLYYLYNDTLIVTRNSIFFPVSFRKIVKFFLFSIYFWFLLFPYVFFFFLFSFFFFSYFVLACPSEPKKVGKYRLCMCSVIYCKTTIGYSLKSRDLQAEDCKKNIRSNSCIYIEGYQSKTTKRLKIIHGKSLENISDVIFLLHFVIFLTYQPPTKVSVLLRLERK